MKLLYSQTSPFARKVMMTLHYTELLKTCDCVKVTFDSDELRTLNPIGKIPAFIDGDLSLFESSLICEYLNDVSVKQGATSLINRTHDHYYEEQKITATANGIMDAGVAIVMEKRRDTEHNPYWLKRWHTAIHTAIANLNIAYAGTAEKPHLASFSLAAALGFLDFRHPDIGWREWNADLEKWFKGIAHTTWFQDTSPHE